MGQQTDSKLGKEYNKAVYCPCVYLTYMQSTSCKMPSWKNRKLDSRLLGEINNLRYADDITVTAESGEELKMRVKEKNEKAGLKLKIQKMKITVSSPIITSQQTDEETVTDFIFLGSKITADGDCSHEIKRRLLLGGKL